MKESKKRAARTAQPTHVLTVRANMTSLTFLFPTILFLIALTESLGLGRKPSDQIYH